MLQYDINLLSELSIWSKSEGRPAIGFVVGDNLNKKMEWFEHLDGKYQLTVTGILGYIDLLERSGKLNDPEWKAVYMGIKEAVESQSVS